MVAERKPTIEELEEDIPRQSPQAFFEARQSHLDSGRSVLTQYGDQIYRVYPDGKREFVKDTAPLIPVDKERIYKLR